MIVAVGSAQEPAAVVGCAKRRLLGSSDGPFMSQARQRPPLAARRCGRRCAQRRRRAVSAFERELPDEYLREGVQKQITEAREAASARTSCRRHRRTLLSREGVSSGRAAPRTRMAARRHRSVPSSSRGN